MKRMEQYWRNPPKIKTYGTMFGIIFHSLAEWEMFLHLSGSPKSKPATEFCNGIRSTIFWNDWSVALSNIYQNTAEIGDWMGESFWNKRIATIGLRLLTAYAFNEYRYIRIYTGISGYDTASMKILLKNGYENDGIYKIAIFKNAKIFFEHRFSKIN